MVSVEASVELGELQPQYVFHLSVLTKRHEVLLLERQVGEIGHVYEMFSRQMASESAGPLILAEALDRGIKPVSDIVVLGRSRKIAEYKEDDREGRRVYYGVVGELPDNFSERNPGVLVLSKRDAVKLDQDAFYRPVIRRAMIHHFDVLRDPGRQPFYEEAYESPHKQKRRAYRTYLKKNTWDFGK